jgi:site-specific DNA-methyltransferase (adenine-specific)
MGKAWDYSVPAVEMWREVLRVLKPGGHLLAFAGTRTQHRMAVNIEDAGWEIRDCVMWVYGSGFPKSHNLKDEWAGWGTALKPAWEPVIVARKPFKGTVASNVLEHGTGAINVDGCSVARQADDRSGWSQTGSKASDNRAMSGGNYARDPKPDRGGRWPANLIHDGSEEVVELFPSETGKSSGTQRTTSASWLGTRSKGEDKPIGYGDTGSAARFFYCAKASKADRGEGNNHPTVKPTDLMAYLCRLVTPPGGTVLDPFCGSGSTGKAAVREGFGFIGIEREAEYARIARCRIKAALEGRAPDLFG